MTTTGKAIMQKPHLTLWWIAAATLLYHWLGYELVSAVFIWTGKGVLPAPQPLDLSDVLALAGIPGGAHFAYIRQQSAAAKAPDE